MADSFSQRLKTEDQESVADPFSRLIERLKAGDPEALAELVREYGPVIRKKMRIRLLDKELQRFQDSADLCQSILAAFIEKNAKGNLQGSLDAMKGKQDLIRFLAAMARNKKIDYVRNQAASCNALEKLRLAASQEIAPKFNIDLVDQLARLKQRFTEKEWRIAQLRAGERTWEQTGAEMEPRLTASAARVCWERALERVQSELNSERRGQ